MGQGYKWSFPKWLEDQPEAEKVRFLIKLAAVYGSPSGALETLSMAIGFSPSAVAKAHRAGKVSYTMAVAIYKFLGDEFHPGIFSPDLFGDRGQN